MFYNCFSSIGDSDIVLVSDSIDFSSYSHWDALFHDIAYDYSHADWDDLHDHLRKFLLEDIFKLSASSAGCKFCDWIQVRIDVYIFIQSISQASLISMFLL